MAKKDGLDYERVPFAAVYHSAVQGPRKPVQAVIRNEGEIKKLLPDTPLPAVDFSGNQLIVVALGDKPTSGYDVRITGVTYFTDRLRTRPPLISVAYTDTEKGGPFDQIYKPIHVVSTRRIEGEVEFEKNVEHRSTYEGGRMSTTNKQNHPGKCSNWKAWIDAMPPGRRLHVQGECIYPSAGWTVTLKKHEPQGINKAVLILDRIAEPPRDRAAQKETTYKPAYEQKLGPDENYDKVTIMPDDVSMDVEVVH